MKYQNSTFNIYSTKSIYQILFSFLFVFSFSLEGNSGIIYPSKDSTIQEIIEFTHSQKDKKGFFKKGDEVVVYTEDKAVITKGAIEDFTEDGIIIDGKEIPLKEIDLIRGKSVLGFVLSIFSNISLVGSILLIAPIALSILLFRRLLNEAGTLIEILIVFVVGILVLFTLASLLLILLSLGIIFAIASSISKRINKSYSLRKKWAAKIATKKFPVEIEKPKRKNRKGKSKK